MDTAMVGNYLWGARTRAAATKKNSLGYTLALQGERPRNAYDAYHRLAAATYFDPHHWPQNSGYYSTTLFTL